MPRWMEWWIDNRRGRHVKVFSGRVSSAALDVEAGAGSWAELYVATHDSKDTEVIVRLIGGGTAARRTMPDTPEELLAWYRAVVRLQRPN